MNSGEKVVNCKLVCRAHRNGKPVFFPCQMQVADHPNINRIITSSIFGKYKK
jgi:hypothetical protein